MRKLYVSLLVAALFAASATAEAQEQSYRLNTAKSSIQVLGDSTLHEFTVTATEWWGSAKVIQARPYLKGQAEVVVSVPALKSGNGNRDKKMYEMFDAQHFPEIRFKAYTPEDTLDKTLHGELTIHGVSHEVQIPVRMYWDEAGLHVSGGYVINLSDYGLKPPSVLGLVKVKPTVTLNFESLWEPEA